MNYGFVKVAAAVPRVKIADCKYNAGQLESLIAIADGKGVQIITFLKCVSQPILAVICSGSNFYWKRPKWG